MHVRDDHSVFFRDRIRGQTAIGVRYSF